MVLNKLKEKPRQLSRPEYSISNGITLQAPTGVCMPPTDI